MSATATESTAFLTEFEDGVDGFEEFEQGDGMDFEDDDDDEEEDWRSEQVVTFPAHAPIQLSTETFASREPTLPSTEREQLSRTPSPEANGVSAEEDDRGKSPSTPPVSSNSSEDEDVMMMDHHKRFLRLQAFLKLCDESEDDKRALVQALRSLSAPARSGHAISLEYRALMLSIEEGKEMLRLKMLNVMGTKSKDNSASTPSQQTSSSSQEAGSTPVGSRLPAPGAERQ